MNEPTPPDRLAEQVGNKAARKAHARRDRTPGLWSGLGTMGLIGWSVAVPTLLGAGLGMWLDAKYPGARPWTLALLMAGLVLGCVNAWHWVSQQDKEINETGQEEN